MTESQQAYWEAVRAQFDAQPYPNNPLDEHPHKDLGYLAHHSFISAYYLRNHEVIETHGKWILDAGCGSGYKLLALAVANPGAHIVGIDISQKSLELAQKRLEYHQIKNTVEFHCTTVEDLPSLNHTFDYINCDDVLYLLEDPVMGLQAMKAVLKPEGIIRVNMHSALQRVNIFRAQEFFTRLGCLQGEPTDEEISLTRQTMSALEDWVLIKRQTWKEEAEKIDAVILANYLLKGDKGITMDKFSSFLRQVKLEFISMVNWRKWNLETLFKDITELPIPVALGIAEMNIEEQIHLFELLHPIHRLLDLYCGHPGQGKERLPVEEWSDSQWKAVTIHLHPQLRTDTFKQKLLDGTLNLGQIHLHELLKIAGDFAIDASIASCLYPLLEAPQPMPALVDRWLTVRPLHPITLQPSDPTEAFDTMRACLTQLEDAGYVMLELPTE